MDRSSDFYSKPTMASNYTIYCRSKQQGGFFFTDPYTIRRQRQAIKRAVGKLFTPLLAGAVGVMKATHMTNRLERKK